MGHVSRCTTCLVETRPIIIQLSDFGSGHGSGFCSTLCFQTFERWNLSRSELPLLQFFLNERAAR